MDGKPKTAIEMSMNQPVYEEVRLETDDNKINNKSISRQNTRCQTWMKMILIMMIISILLAGISPIITKRLFKSNLQETLRNLQDFQVKMTHLEENANNIKSDLIAEIEKQREIQGNDFHLRMNQLEEKTKNMKLDLIDEIERQRSIQEHENQSKNIELEEELKILKSDLIDEMKKQRQIQESDNQVRMVHLEEETRSIKSDLIGEIKKQGQIQEIEIVGQDFKFDRSTLYKNLYISKDGMTVSNYKSSTEMEKENGSFQNYQGVRGTRGFSQFESIYYEVDVYYKILSKFTGNWLAFELGFSTGDTIDNHHYVGFQKKSWSVHAVRDNVTKTIKITRQVSKGASYKIKTLSSETIHTTYQETFAFHVNGPQRKITCFERQDNSLEKLYTFTNVDFAQQIYPVFGLYSPSTFRVRLYLKTVKYMKKTFPEALHDFM